MPWDLEFLQTGEKMYKGYNQIFFIIKNADVQ